MPEAEREIQILEIRKAAAEAKLLIANDQAQAVKLVREAEAMASTNLATQSSKDHDLLIQVNTKQDVMIERLGGMENKIDKRIDHIELSKLDVAVFQDFKATATTSISTLERGVEKLLSEHTKMFESTESNQNSRMNKMSDDIDGLKKFMWKTTGALLIISIALPIVLRLWK